MTDVMKLAMERRSRVTAEIERLKEEVTRLNQFIRMGESLISQAASSGAAPQATAGVSQPGANGVEKSSSSPQATPTTTVTGFPGSRPGA